MQTVMIHVPITLSYLKSRDIKNMIVFPNCAFARATRSFGIIAPVFTGFVTAFGICIEYVSVLTNRYSDV